MDSSTSPWDGCKTNLIKQTNTLDEINDDLANLSDHFKAQTSLALKQGVHAYVSPKYVDHTYTSQANSTQPCIEHKYAAQSSMTHLHGTHSHMYQPYALRMYSLALDRQAMATDSSTSPDRTNREDHAISPWFCSSQAQSCSQIGRHYTSDHVISPPHVEKSDLLSRVESMTQNSNMINVHANGMGRFVANSMINTNPHTSEAIDANAAPLKGAYTHTCSKEARPSMSVAASEFGKDTAPHHAESRPATGIEVTVDSSSFSLGSSNEYMSPPHRKWIPKAEANAKCDNCHQKPMTDLNRQTLVQRCVTCSRQLCMMCFVEYGVDTKHPVDLERILDWSPTRQEKLRAKRFKERETRPSPSSARGRTSGCAKIQRSAAEETKARLVEDEESDTNDSDEACVEKVTRKPLDPAKRKKQQKTSRGRSIRAAKCRKSSLGYASYPMPDLDLEDDQSDTSNDETNSEYVESDQEHQNNFVHGKFQARRHKSSASSAVPKTPRRQVAMKSKPSTKVPLDPYFSEASKVYMELHGTQRGPYTGCSKSNKREVVEAELEEQKRILRVTNPVTLKLILAGKAKEAEDMLDAAMTLSLMQAGVFEPSN